MDYPLWSEAKTKIKNDLDLTGEDFISDTELMDLGNEALDDLEAEILTLNQDYFLNEESLSLVSGTAEYSLPSTIYANKIRRLIYANGSDIYEIKRYRKQDKFIQIALDRLAGSGTTQDLRYLIKNTVTTGVPAVKLLFSPTPAVTGAYVTVWFLRNVNKITGDSSKIDLFEFYNVFLQHIKVRCMEKEGHPNLPKAMQDLESLKELMRATLAEAVPDEDNEVEKDLSAYWEMS